MTARLGALGLTDFAPRAFPVEFFTLVRDKPGVRLRASVASFGPILLAKVMELNETQESVLAMAFKYAEDRKMPLVDLGGPAGAAQPPEQRPGQEGDGGIRRRGDRHGRAS